MQEFLKMINHYSATGDRGSYAVIDVIVTIPIAEVGVAESVGWLR